MMMNYLLLITVNCTPNWLTSRVGKRDELIDNGIAPTRNITGNMQLFTINFVILKSYGAI